MKSWIRSTDSLSLLKSERIILACRIDVLKSFTPLEPGSQIKPTLNMILLKLSAKKQTPTL